MTLADAQIAAYAPPGDGRSPPATSGSSSGWLAWLWSTRSSRSPAPPPAWRRGQSVAVLAEAVPAPGTWTVTAKATDLVGNVGSAAVDYTVEPWDLRGFQAPVKPGVVVSVETDDGSSLSAEFKLK